ncbi:MAG TPA: hypothetical protein VF174_08960 [Micromonosporaceae bacterium]
MKVKVLYSIAGTVSPLKITGHRITVQTFRERNRGDVQARVAVFDRAGRKIRAVHLSDVHSIDQDCRSKP